MPTAIAMPKLGMSMREGTVLEWRASPGERVEKGQILLVIESEKAEAEIEAPAAGVFRHRYVEEQLTVACGTLLAALTEQPDDAFDAESYRQAQERTPAATPSRSLVSQPVTGGTAAAAPRSHAARAPVTPAARRRARELDLDPLSVVGTGPGGRVTREDIDAQAEALEARCPVGGGVFLEVQRLGEGEPVLLLPGFGTDVTAFARQLPVLAERHRVLALNPRGVGLSDAPEADAYDLATAAADALAVAAGPAHVVGASLGAAVALELVLAHPESVRSLTLVSPFIRVGARLLAVLESWCRLREEATPEGLAKALLPWLFSEELLADERRSQRTVRALAEISRRCSAETLRRTLRGIRRWSGTRASDLGEIRVPCLVILAGADLLIPDGDSVASAIPGARCSTVPRAGHAVSLDAPEPVNELLLEQLEGAGRAP